MEVVESVPRSTPKFRTGQVVHHRKLDHLAVVVDVDPTFAGTEEWYERSAKNRPPKDRPWYHVLVDGVKKQIYVAERHLAPVEEPEPIDHPWLRLYFDAFVEGIYVRTRRMN